MTTTGTKRVIEEWFEVFNTGEVDRLGRIHAATCRNHAPGPFDLDEWPGEGRPFRPDDLAETITWLRSNQPDLRVEMESLLAEGDQVVAWIRSTGTPTGPGPIPPTGRPVDFHHAHRFRIRDGQVIEHWAVRDDLRSMLQAGLLARPGGAAR